MLLHQVIQKVCFSPVVSLRSLFDTIINHKYSFPDSVIRFRDSQFLVLANRVLALVFSMIALLFMRTRKQGNGYLEMSNTRVYLIAPLYEFSYCSLSNVLSSWCQYEALKYVNFPTQVNFSMTLFLCRSMIQFPRHYCSVYPMLLLCHEQ